MRCWWWVCWLVCGAWPALAAERPNILWISAEDISPDLGCYGDTYARTPHIDQLAREGVRYTRCFTHAAVCAPSRSGVITGMYPNSIGTLHMRCGGVPPHDTVCFSEGLRAAGYYCTNNVKTDYQFAVPDTAWDENSNSADWRGRAAGQPFFCVMNLTTTHESQVRTEAAATAKRIARVPVAERHDPAAAVLPPYYPDTPVVRRDWANYYDNLTALDLQVRDVLERLQADGLAENTIVWFWGDHGRGLSRGKRWLYDSGTQTPLIVRIPERWREWVAGPQGHKAAPGDVDERLIAFVDFAPTMRSLAGLGSHEKLQGQPFLGPLATTENRTYVYGHRDRMDETYETIRMVRDTRYKYLRNLRPELPYAQPIAYMDLMPMMQDWRRLAAAGMLSPAAQQFFRPTKPMEELFDTETDPHELTNLANAPEHRATLVRLRRACRDWMAEIGDVGLMPESMMDVRQRPQHNPQRAAEPLWERTGRQVTFSAPRGGSVAVQRGGVDADRPEQKGRWKLASGPFELPADGVLFAKTCRLGWLDSAIVRVGPETSPSPPMGNATATPSDWQAEWRTDPALAALLDQFELEVTTPRAGRARWAELRNDSAAAVRWWAAVRLGGIEPDLATLRELLSDAHPAVRVAAAAGLLRDHDDAQAVDVLLKVRALQEAASLQWEALTALNEVRVPVAEVAAAMADAKGDTEYETRLKQRARQRWGLSNGKE